MIIKIDRPTPEATRNAIVKYLNEQASHYRRQGMTGKGKNLARARLELAKNLDTIAATLSVAPIDSAVEPAQPE